jgi:hypothetical protein
MNSVKRPFVVGGPMIEEPSDIGVENIPLAPCTVGRQEEPNF